MQYFGKKHDAPVYDDGTLVATPVGKTCDWCKEDVIRGEDGFVLPGLLKEGDDYVGRLVVFHRECYLRQSIGSLGHQKKTCSCYVRTGGEEDPPDMTIREAAKAATNYFFAKHRIDLIH